MTKKNDLTNIITFQVGGTRYAVDLYDLDGIEWRDAKAAALMKQHDLIEAALVDRDFDAIAALIWVWRRRTEPALAYESVLKGMSFRNIIEPVAEAEAEDKPNPPD